MIPGVNAKAEPRPMPIKGGAIIDHETPDKRRFAAVPK
jgi:hypothetical protein